MCLQDDQYPTSKAVLPSLSLTKAILFETDSQKPHKQDSHTAH